MGLHIIEMVDVEHYMNVTGVTLVSARLMYTELISWCVNTGSGQRNEVRRGSIGGPSHCDTGFA